MTCFALITNKIPIAVSCRPGSFSFCPGLFLVIVASMIKISFFGLLFAGVMLGCGEGASVAKKDPPAPAAKKVKIGKNVYLEVDGDKRRVLIDAYVCLRQGQLEQFLTRKRTKEHEAILAADIDASDIHKALLLAQAEPGKPVQFRPQYQPATGSVIKIKLLYDDRGKKREVPARQWVRDQKGKELDQDWVFGGSLLLPDPFDATKPPYYAGQRRRCYMRFQL